MKKQYDDDGVPWAGTFRVCAEEVAPPSDGAVEWLHYDPNWRQFSGCVLAFAGVSPPATPTCDGPLAGASLIFFTVVP